MYRRLFLALLALASLSGIAHFEDLPPEEAAFLRAIIAEPEEDTPRLAYADWLDEHNDPLRAEFIRLQVKLSRMDPKDETFASLQGRERALLGMPKATRIPKEYADIRKNLMERLLPKKTRNAEEQSYLTDIHHHPHSNDSWLIYADWLQDQGGESDYTLANSIRNAMVGNYLQVEYSRGFPEGIRCSRAALEESGNEILNAMPFLRSLTITHEIRDPYPQETARIISRSKAAANVQALSLLFIIDVGDMHLIAPRFTRLRDLHLHDPPSNTLEALLLSPLGTRLHTLDVHYGDEHWWPDVERNRLISAFASWARQNPELKEISSELHALLPPALQKTVKAIYHQSDCVRFLGYFATH